MGHKIYSSGHNWLNFFGRQFLYSSTPFSAGKPVDRYRENVTQHSRRFEHGGTPSGCNHGSSRETHKSAESSVVAVTDVALLLERGQRYCLVRSQSQFHSIEGPECGYFFH